VDYLTQLILRIVAHYQESTDATSPRELGVPRQEDAILGPRFAGQFMIAGARIHRIVPQQAEPGSQSTEHGVAQKLHNSLAGIIPSS